ncbi:MAG TPA: response regulator [Baekduia sp.]|nr:response regulator [Baekduia sp.]
MARRQILVVDDSPVVRELARMGLETIAGWDVRPAESGGEALRRAAADAPEAILLDVVMPEMDGPATLLELQGRAITRDIPVIFVTAKDHPADRARLAALGAAGVIAKPFEVRELAAQVAEILGWETTA